jgi:hypothetical protein
VRRAVLAVGLAVVVGGTAPSHADVLCTTRSGALRVRSACKRREKPVDITTLGPVGAPGAPGDPGPPAPAGQLIDTAGQRLSPTLLKEEGLNTPLRIGDVVVDAGVHVDGFSTSVRLVYESPDCAGAPLVEAYNGLVRRVFFMGTTAYYPGDPIQFRATMSHAETMTEVDCMLDGGTFNGGFCCFNSSDMLGTGPAIAVDVSGIVSRFPISIAVVP